MISPYKADMANMLANGCLFTHSVDMGRHQLLFEVVFLAGLTFAPLYLCSTCGLLTEISGSSAVKAPRSPVGC